MYHVSGQLNHDYDSAVLIPSYQDNEGLLITLRSLNEEESSVNILVVDDGSTISVVSGLRDFVSHHNIVVITLKENQGIITALNTGLDYCSDNNIRFVYRLDAHDINVKGRLEHQKALMKSSGAALVGGAVEFFGESGQSISILQLPTESSDIKKLQIFRSCFVHPAVLLDLQLLGKGFRYSHDFRHAEDYEFFLRISRSFDVANIEQVVTRCLIRSGGISLSNRKAQINSVFKTQFKYFDWSSRYSYLGVAKTTFLYLFPRDLVEFIKIKVLKVHQ